MVFIICIRLCAYLPLSSIDATNVMLDIIARVLLTCSELHLGNAIPIPRDPDLARSRVIFRDQSRRIIWRDPVRDWRDWAAVVSDATHTQPSPFARIYTSTSLDKLESTIKKEMDLLECGGTRGRFLQFAYNCFATLLPTSVESERAFSAAGYIATDIRCRLADETINTLCFLRSHFQNHSFS